MISCVSIPTKCLVWNEVLVPGHESVGGVNTYRWSVGDDWSSTGVNSDWVSREEIMLSLSKPEGGSELEACRVVSCCVVIGGML